MPPFNIDKLIATGAIPQERAVTEEFKQATKEWVELKKQLNAVNKDVRVLKDREKKLKIIILGNMKQERITNVNLSKGEKITFKATARRAPFTQKAVQEALEKYFNGDMAQVEAIMTMILDSLEIRETENISLTGIKNL